MLTDAERIRGLMAENAALREIVQALADNRWLATRESLRELIAKARALLAAQ